MTSWSILLVNKNKNFINTPNGLPIKICVEDVKRYPENGPRDWIQVLQADQKISPYTSFWPSSV